MSTITTKKLTHKECWFTANALRMAAAQWAKDIANPAYITHAPDIVETFKRQIVQAEALATLLERCPTVTIEDED